MKKENQENEQWKLLVLLLKEIAENKGIKQEEIAQQTGMLQSAVSRFFSLKFKPTLDTFLQIAKAIKVNFFFEDQERKIEQKVKDLVWNRDNGKCVLCGSNEKLEFDHIIPFSKGGSNTYRNIQILCEKCNREKSNKIG